MFDTWDEYVKKSKAEGGNSKELIESSEMISDIISAIIKKRLDLKLTQRTLAKLCRLPQSTLARIEANIVSPNLETLIKILQPLGLKIQITLA